VAEGDTYYWAGGRRIPLAASSDVVIDLDSAAGAGLAAPQLDGLRAAGRSLTGSLLMVPGADAAATLGDGLGALSGVHPVYRSEDGSLVVVLPEVRVEASDPGALGAVRRSLTTAHVVEETDDRLVLAPDSGRGADALALANELAESRSTDLAQARFVRVVPRPGPR
jgi:hypothetical protein